MKEANLCGSANRKYIECLWIRFLRRELMLRAWISGAGSDSGRGEVIWKRRRLGLGRCEEIEEGSKRSG